MVFHMVYFDTTGIVSLHEQTLYFMV